MSRLSVFVSVIALTSAMCDHQPVASGKQTLNNQGRMREFYIHVPSGYDTNVPTPVVVLFHGWGYSGLEWYSGKGSGAVSARPSADKNGYILVSPTGLTDSSLTGNCDNGNGYCSWNAAGTTGSPGPEGMTCNPNRQRTDYCYRDTCIDGCKDICWWTTCNDDATFVHAMIDRVEELLCVDIDRVYAGGESNGGVMVWEMATDPRAGRFAAFVPMIGLPHHGFDFRPSHLPLPIMGIWGSSDRTIPPGNNDADYTESSDGWYYTTARSITKDWSEAHGCSVTGNPVAYPTTFSGQNGLTCTSFSNGCTHGSAPSVDCRFTGGHVILGFFPDLAWEFFSKHSRAGKTFNKNNVYNATD